ncbi:hemophore-related protein [Mycobacterium sp.]|uniref:hemophore-related protein n=1 Tax=Mycobacterium sp. TaxID=1785 RepID=UPI003D6A5242
MATPSLTRLAVAVGGLALSLTAGVGVASAEPAVNTTCSYPQVVGALNAQDPAAAAKFNASPAAQGWLQNFLASPPPQRESMLQQVQGTPRGRQYAGLVEQLASTCHNY